MAQSWSDRNRKAQAAGYRNYYDYRIHNYGKIPASAEPPAGLRSFLRGHRSYNDLRRRIRSTGDKRIEVWNLVPTKRNAKGQIVQAEVVVQLRDFTQETYTLRGKHLSHGKRSLLREVRPERLDRFRESLPRKERKFFDGLSAAGQGIYAEGSDYSPGGGAYSSAEIEYLSNLPPEEVEDYLFDAGGWPDYIGDLWDDLQEYDIDISDPYTGELA